MAGDRGDLPDSTASLCESILHGLKLMEGDRDDCLRAAAVFENVTARILNLESSSLLGLSGESLVVLSRLSMMSESQASYCIYCLNLAYMAHARVASPLADIRHRQAAALGNAFGLDLLTVPLEIQDALSDTCS